MKWFAFLLLTGCTVQLSRPIPIELVDASVRFNDVKPVFKNRCMPCHDWTAYNNAYQNRDRIKLRLLNKTMPPNDLILASERDLVILWINEGAKQ